MKRKPQNSSPGPERIALERGPLDEAAAIEADSVQLTLSKRKAKKLAAVEVVNAKRERGAQDLVYNSRPFVLCCLPIRRPQKSVLEYTRQNGKFFLSLAGHPRFGLPFGQDRIIPIWVATLALRQNSKTVRFRTASQMLETFGLQKSGANYRRLIEGFQRIFASTIFFGTEDQARKDVVFDWARFHYFDRMQLWFNRHDDQEALPGEEFENVIELSDSFWREIQNHPIPVDAEVVKGLSDAPGNLDFYMWLSWRCFKSKGVEYISLCGPGSLEQQMGMTEYKRERRFKQKIREWLTITKRFWPDCPADVSPDGQYLIIAPGKSINGPSQP